MKPPAAVDPRLPDDVHLLCSGHEAKGTAMISDELLNRLRERANDPERRNGNASISGQAVDLGTLLGQLGPAGDQFKAMQDQMSGLMGQFASMMQGFGVVNPMPQRAEGDQRSQVPPPAGADQIEAAEQSLGFALPEDLKRLYSDVADGSFGPGEGLRRLTDLVAEYRDFTSEPFGPLGQAWPANLLPLCHDDPGEICLDRDSGKLIFWDPEELGEGQGDKYWQRSFKDEADNLSAWLEKWLGEPTAMERMQAQRDEVMRNPMETHIRNMIESCGRMTPEERADLGFGGDDWEEQIRQRYAGL
jgi:hypothetical protein